MAKQAIFEHEGMIIAYANAGNEEIKVGDVVPLVSRIGVALEDITPDAVGGVRLVGVWGMPAVNNAAFDVGDKLYWDTEAKKLTKVDGEKTVPAGICTEAKVANGTVSSVRIG